MRRDITVPRGPTGREAVVRKTLQAAIGAIGAGRLDEASQILEADKAALKTPVGQNVRGDIHLKQGKPAEALRAFDAAIKLAPHMPEAHCNRGVALQEMGRLEEALAAEERALRNRPDYPMANFNRGNVLKAMTRMEEAVAAYTKALGAQPSFPEALLNRGFALLVLGKSLEALADFGRVLALRPHYISAHVGRAGAYRDLGDFAQAFAAIDAAAAIEPDNVDAVLIRASVLVAAERFDEALRTAQAIVARHPDDGRAQVTLALALWKLRRFDEALAAADEAARLAPHNHEAHEARGIVLGELGRLEESLAALDTARRFGASGGAYFHARAVAIAGLGDPAEALASFERALEIAPSDPTAHYNRGFLYLSIGRLAEGWADHEWRLKLREQGHFEKQALAPLWRGENLEGKKLLVYAEQGHGDTIQFTRYLPQVAERGGAITLLVQEPLRRLYEPNLPGIDVTGSLGLRSGFDSQISLMSLPFAFGTTLETIPQNVPYLHADPARAEKWRERIGVDGFRVGIAWQGNPTYGRDRDRSIRVGEFAPLTAVNGVRLISLQWSGGAEQLKSLPGGMRVETLGEEIENNPDGFREVAAVMANLDLLIMSDTGPAHLAGALGRPVWVALNDRPDWRWMRQGSASPWYPTMRLFRQKTTGDWPGVFAEMAEELRRLVAARG